MSKRVKSQITKDDFFLERDSLSDRDEEMDPPQKASAEILATRKIAGMGRRFSKKAPSTGAAASSTSILPPSTNGNADLSADQVSQLKSLNANFLKSVNDGINKNPVANLKDICAKYLDYINKVVSKKIEVKTLDVPKVQVNPVTIKTDETKPNPFAMFAKPAATIPAPAPTPSFTVAPPNPAPTPVAAPVSKPEPIEIEESEEEEESDDEVEIKGPTFTTKATIKDSIFKFGKVPARDEDDSDDEIEIKGPTFTLSGTVNDSVFKLPKRDEKKDEAPKPAFGFSLPKPTPAPASTETPVTLPAKPEAPKVSFNFGATPTATTTATAAKPTLNFSAAPALASATDSKLAFNFSVKPIEKPATDAKPTFNFGTPASGSSFSFGAPASTAAPAAAKPAFTFGSTTLPTSTTPASTKAPVLNFGQNTPSTGFNFGATATTKPAESVFSIGKPTSATTTSNPFSIGATSFGSAISSSVFNFTASAPKPAESTAVDTSAQNEDDNDTKEAEKDDVKGNFQVVSLTEKVDVKTGEEDEDVIYTKRSKVSIFNTETNSYDLVGLGDLKVLKNKNTGKSRILARSDGLANVILNISILKDMKYTLIGEKKNTLSIPSPNVNGTLDRYIARVKTEADGQDLLNAIESCQ